MILINLLTHTDTCINFVFSSSHIGLSTCDRYFLWSCDPDRKFPVQHKSNFDANLLDS